MPRIISLASGLVALFMWACQPLPEEHEEAGVFAVTTPRRQDVELTHEYVAQVQAIQHIEVRAQERGYLTEIFVDEGQLIEAGTKMFQIMPLIYRADLRRAEAEADMASIEYKNTKLLADKDIVSPAELALAGAKLNRAKAELSLAQTHMRLTEIRAPFTGLMDRFAVRLGSLLDEGELLTTLSDNRTLWIYFNVTEAEYLDYKARTPTTSARPRSEFKMANNGSCSTRPARSRPSRPTSTTRPATSLSGPASPTPPGCCATARPANHRRGDEVPQCAS